MNTFEPLTNSSSRQSTYLAVTKPSDSPVCGLRGRPSGPAAVVVPRHLCLHDLAMLRAVIQGVGIGQAAKRYLPEVHADERVARQYFRRAAEVAVLVLEQTNTTNEVVQSLRSRLARAQSIHTVTTSATDNMELGHRGSGQSFEDFVEGLDDPDAWSESDLIELYQAEVGVDPATVCRACKDGALEQALQGLSVIQMTGVKSPKVHDALTLWLSPSLCRRLHAMEVRTLYDLVNWINRHGLHWYRKVPGVGTSRGQRLWAWLNDHREFLTPARLLPHSTNEDNRAGHGLLVFTKGQCTALDALNQGVLRASGTNALGAQTDRQAIEAWLATLGFRSSHTRRAYAQDVARLLAWAIRERGKSLSDLTVEDAAEHARFLQSPPEHWLCVQTVDRQQYGRLRGPLAPSSVKRVLAAISHFYGFLVEVNYLKANPFSHIRLPMQRGVLMDVSRSFGSVHMQAMAKTLALMKNTPKKRRLQAILGLLESTGLRIGEIPSSWAAVVDKHDAEAGTVKCLCVTGKGGRERLLPLRQEVLDILQVHRADQLGVDIGGALQPSLHPLIGRIDEPISNTDDSGPALSTERIRAVLKAFFAQVANGTDDLVVAEQIRRATPHYLRHTFAHKVLHATRQDLAVTQQLLGHQSLATTGIYVKAGLARRLDAIGSLELSLSSAWKQNDESEKDASV